MVGVAEDHHVAELRKEVGGQRYGVGQVVAKIHQYIVHMNALI